MKGANFLHLLLKGVTMKNSLPKIHWIEIPTMELWLKLGTIWETDRGSENIYFTDECELGRQTSGGIS